MGDDEQILESLFLAICSSDDTWYWAESVAVPEQLLTSHVNDLGMARWSAVRLATSPDVLAELYSAVPGPLPKLFESLLLAYRWARVALSEATLFGNPPGPTLRGFEQEITSDRSLHSVLFENRLVEFGKAPGGSYDPICFDLKRSKGGDCPILRIEHESVLINGRVRVVGEVAPNFRALAQRVGRTG